MSNYSFDSDAAYVFDQRVVFKVDDVLAVREQSQENPLPVWNTCFIITFYAEDGLIHVQLMDDIGRMLSIPLYKLHQLLLNDKIGFRHTVGGDDTRLISVARQRGAPATRC